MELIASVWQGKFIRVSLQLDKFCYERCMLGTWKTGSPFIRTWSSLGFGGELSLLAAA